MNPIPSVPYVTILQERRETSMEIQAKYPMGLFTIPPTNGDIGRWDARVDSLNCEIEATKGTLGALVQELALIQSARTRAQNSSSPSFLIPEEVLAAIFRIGYHEAGATSLTDESTFLSAITSTCHYWRQTAINSACLWTNIVVRAGDVGPRMSLYLERSRQAPLRFTMIADHHSNKLAQEQIQNWIDSLITCFARTRSLTVRTTDHDVAQKIFPLNVPMPVLEYFALEASDLVSDRRLLDRPALTLMASAVTSLDRIILSIRDSPLPITWCRDQMTTMTHLKLDGWAACPTRDVVHLVRQCTKLKSLCWLQALDEDILHGDDMGIFSSPTLESLQMDLPAKGSERSSVIWTMDFPNLKHLTIYAVIGDSEWVDPALGTVQRFPMLETLWLSSAAFSSTAVNAFLSAHHTIEEFGCRLHPSVGGVLNVLAETTSTLPPKARSPNLRFMYILGASKTYEGEIQPAEVVTQICAAIRSILRARGAGVGASVGRGTGLSPLEIQLNDQTWKSEDLIPEEYLSLYREFPTCLHLSGNDDTIPTRFNPA